MNKNEKKKILMLFLMAWLFFGECVCLAIWSVRLSIFVSIFFICGFAFLLKISDTNFIKIFKSYKAQRKGQMLYGYIFQIVERDKKNDNVFDNILDMQPYTNRKEMAKMLREITGKLVLKIIVYDDSKMETNILEYEVSVATAINENISDKQYVCMYKYKNKYYMLTDEYIVPKFLIPKDYRKKIKENLDIN